MDHPLLVGPAGPPRRLAAAVAFALTAVLFTAVGVAVSRASGPPPAEDVTLARVGEGITAAASLRSHPWGTELLLDVEGLQEGQDYTVTFVDTAGSRVPGGTLRGTRRPVRARVTAAVARGEVLAFEVTSEQGELVVAAIVPRP